MPREEDEFDLSYYNSMTTWIDLDAFLDLFGLTREDILADDQEKISCRRAGASPPISRPTSRSRT